MGSLIAKYKKAKFMHYSTYIRSFLTRWYVQSQITVQECGVWVSSNLLTKYYSLHVELSCEPTDMWQKPVYGQTWVGYRTPVEETLK